VTESGAQPSSSYEPAVLEALLSEARRFGFLGPGPVTAQMERSLAFAKMVTAVPQIAVDLGSGGGLPGLVLALTWPSSRWVFVESNQRRAAWLESALETLGAANRVDVLCDRAENIARTTLRGASDLVTARSFAPPAPTAECAAPLLKLGALLLVAEPPGSPLSRWSVEGLAELGLVLERTHVVGTEGGPTTISGLVAASPCPPRYPRRVGVPFKRPLF
jgi:16S rRNA (guanine527-N7)-methyltransferase